MRRVARAVAALELVVFPLGAFALGASGAACHGTQRSETLAGAGGAAPSGSGSVARAKGGGSAAPSSLRPPPLPERLPARPPESSTVASAGCRVMRVTGDVRRSEAPLAAGARLDGPPALELAAKATVHLVHTRSTRQWVVSGPARLVACEGGEEELWLAAGNVRVEPGSGVRPGAEVWIGTPFGSIRYGDARAEISAGARELAVSVASGEVWFVPLGGESRAERHLVAGKTSFAADPYRLASERALARCGSDAELAQSRARALLAPLEEPLGPLAAEHVRARQRAHASCASARAAELAAAPQRDHEAGLQALARYDQLWRTVPGPAPAAPAP